jgi:hypothetical protein
MQRAAPERRARRARAAASLALTLSVALVASACRHAAGLPPRLRACDGPLRDAAEIAGDFTRHARIRVRAAGVDDSFGLVLQKTGARLVVLGTNAFGAKAFAVTQRGERFEARSFIGPALSVPPENVLRDLHRAWFLTPEQSRRSERSAEPAENGVRVVSEKCGYEALISSL